jgi:hypothetical protein
MKAIETDDLMVSFFQFKEENSIKVKGATCVDVCSKYNLSIFGTETGLIFVHDLMGERKDYNIDLNTKISAISVGDRVVCADQEHIFLLNLQREVIEKLPMKNVKDILANPGSFSNITAILTEDQVYFLKEYGLKPLTGDSPTASMRF